MNDFANYCKQCTDRQLANVIQKEHGRHNKYGDRDSAESVARERGWDATRIKDARISGAL